MPCNVDEGCLEGFKCVEQHCEKQAADYSGQPGLPCGVDQDCLEGFKCEEHHCIQRDLMEMRSDTPWCSKDEDCLLAGPGFRCENEFCVKD